MFKTVKNLLFKISIFLPFLMSPVSSELAGAGVLPLDKTEIDKQIENLKDFYEFSEKIICSQEIAPSLKDPIRGLFNHEDLVESICKTLPFDSCYVRDREIIIIKIKNNLFQIQFQNDDIYPTFMAFIVYNLVPNSDPTTPYLAMIQAKRDTEILSAYFLKNKLPCQPYSISRTHFETNGMPKKKEIVTGSDKGVLFDTFYFETKKVHSDFMGARDYKQKTIEKADSILTLGAVSDRTEALKPGSLPDQAPILPSRKDLPPLKKELSVGAESKFKMTNEIHFLTDRSFQDCMERVGMTEEQLQENKGAKFLSVGEGNSNFVAELAKRGINSIAVDATLKNVHIPERSVIAPAQNLPFEEGHFDKALSIWLFPHFYNKNSINDPGAGNQALDEMIRVTKVGGEIIINPINRDCTQILDYFEILAQAGKVKYELTYVENRTRKVVSSEALKEKELYSRIIFSPSSGHMKTATGDQTNTIRVIKL